jgi:hypothetical protein
VLPKKLYLSVAVSPKDINIPYSIEIRAPLQIVIRLRAESKTLLNQINNLHNFSFGNKNCCYNARLTNGFVLAKTSESSDSSISFPDEDEMDDPAK